jgi:hypothetical protein
MDKGKRGGRGSALLILLLVVVAVAGAVAALLTVERGRQLRTVAEVYQDRAFQLAEATVDEAAVLLNANALSANGSIDWSDDGLDNDGDGLDDEGDEEVSASLTSWGSDGLDNDADGQVDEKDEKVVRVASLATIGTSTRALTGWLRRSAADLPNPTAAVYLDDPLANTTFSGNAFSVNGNDRNLDGTPGPASPLWGISINGDPSQVIGQLGNQQMDNVLGAGGFPSVGTFNPADPEFIQHVIDALGPQAGITLNNYGGTYTGNLGNWQTGNFIITLSNGSLSIGGGSQGAGILLVEGNLVISGSWDYVGYVFVTGEVVMSGGGGTKRLRGAMFVGGDVIQGSSSSAGTDLLINGSIDLGYSSQALDLVREAFGNYRVEALTEP